ncbi:hypothetical protein ACIPC1_29000 [Streptomyces sp. NPDC087263]|uniref:hypothetical protein n=1 Tax=Streptomyces sp. NPDC087263 TaxID=3365773 RepID=UPI003804DE3F
MAPAAMPVIDGLSARALSEIFRLERTRNYLQPGDVRTALRLWKDYVRRPERQLWHDHEWGNVHWYCCGNPLEARALLDTVMRAMSSRSARELRQIISRSDAVWNRPSPRSSPVPQNRGARGTRRPGQDPAW